MADPSKIGQAFLQEYYGRLDSNRRTTMHELYVRNFSPSHFFIFVRISSTFFIVFFFTQHNTAVMNFEGTAFGGKKAIQEKLMSLGSAATSQAASIAHSIKQMDFSWGPIPKQTVLAFVSGVLTIDGGNPLQFAQVLQIAHIGGSWSLSNDMFRFIYKY